MLVCCLGNMNSRGYVLKKEIFDKFQNILSKKFGFDKNKVKASSTLRDDLGIDSFTAVELVFTLEDEYKIEISDEEMSKLETVKDVVEAIEQKLQ